MKQGLLSERVIACAIEVQRELGYGFLEKVYENALVVELAKCGLRLEQQKSLRAIYRGVIVGDFVADLIIENRLLVELKSVERVAPLHKAQLLNYLRATRLSVGLLLNFGPSRLGIDRIVHNYDEGAPI